jgi:subtilisin family serine protease
VAGVAALVLSRNPALRWDAVRDIIRRSCDRIDRRGGKYDAGGRSRYYGYGRVNARRAVDLADRG